VQKKEKIGSTNCVDNAFATGSLKAGKCSASLSCEPQMDMQVSEDEDSEEEEDEDDEDLVKDITLERFLSKKDGCKHIQGSLIGTADEDPARWGRQVGTIFDEPQNWGICVKSMLKFFRFIQMDLYRYCKAQRIRGDLHVVASRFIKPWTLGFQPHGFASVMNANSLLAFRFTSPAAIMKARVFVSVCWNAHFGRFVTTMAESFDPEEVVWIGALSICQHLPVCESIEDSPIYRALHPGMRVVLFVDQFAEVRERAWCGLEVYLATEELSLPFSVCLPGNLDKEMWKGIELKLQSLSLDSCKCSEDSDASQILPLIESKIHVIERRIYDESRRASIIAFAGRGIESEGNSLCTEEIVQIGTDCAGRSVLHLWARRGKLDLLGVLLQNDVPVDCRNGIGKSPLHYAAEQGHETIARLFLEKRADVNLKDNLQRSALGLAAAKGHVIIVTLLLNAGAEIESMDRDGFTPLLTSAVKGHALVTSELIRCYANLEVRDHRNGLTALAMASHSDHIETVDALVEGGAALDCIDSSGCTALMYASAFGHITVVVSLLRGGADATIKDPHNYTAFDFATDEGRGNIVALLSRHAQSQSRKDTDAKTVVTVHIGSVPEGNILRVMCYSLSGSRCFQADFEGDCRVGLLAHHMRGQLKWTTMQFFEDTAGAQHVQTDRLLKDYTCLSVQCVSG